MYFEILVNGEKICPKWFELYLTDHDKKIYVSNTLSQTEIESCSFEEVFNILNEKVDEMMTKAAPLIEFYNKTKEVEKRKTVVKTLRELADSIEYSGVISIANPNNLQS